MNYVQLTLNLLTTTIVAPPSNASKWQMGFNSAFKVLRYKTESSNCHYQNIQPAVQRTRKYVRFRRSAASLYKPPCDIDAHSNSCTLTLTLILVH
jgi:predicted amidophosphoribosyltransferase